jgi:hypothetical protein
MAREGLIAALAAGLAACGGTAAVPPDAGPDAPPTMPDGGGDAMAAACHELDAPELTATTLPAHLHGDLAGAGADLKAPMGCAEVDAPYGVQSDGVDEVIQVDGLSAGVDYVVRLDGAADLSFYVVTGCSSPTGPADRDCMLFVDGTTSGTEVGHFVAPDGPVWIVVDYYASQPPQDADFTLDVYRSECTADPDCTGSTPACLDGQCVECVTGFDCQSPTAPVCDGGTHRCKPGTGACTGDDGPPTENGDDGPAGARVLVPDGTGRASLPGHVCNDPSTERDYYAFTVGTPGEDWELTLDWQSGADLDLVVYDAGGNLVGMSLYEHPEDVALTYLPAGTYYAAVSYYATQTVSAATSYTLHALQIADSCQRTADCAAVYRNQIYRGDCQAGACVAIDGAGQVPAGAACDSVSDCASGTSCASFYFVSGADTRDVCGPFCDHDSDCTAALGAGYVCTTYLQQNFCVQQCTTDSQCPVSTTQYPQSGPWARLSCDRPSGRCLP